MVKPPQPAFVGRALELDVLAQSLRSVRAGRACVVLVAGEPGVGKTALLRRFMSTAPDLQPLVACGDEAEARLPYGLIDQLTRCAGSSATALALLASDPTADPLRVGAGLLDLLGGLQEAGPVAVVVDDAQWADGPSLRAITFALRRLSADAVLGLVAVRTAEAAAALPPGLHRLIASEHGARLRLRGLTAADVRELADELGVGALPMQAAERLRAHTGGLPLHLNALFEELPAKALRQPGKELPAPRSFAAFVVSQMASCSSAAITLAQAAAVLGSPCPLALAGALAELADPLGPLDEAISRQLLVETDIDDQPAIAFAHPLIRAAIYADLGPARRTALHCRAAELYGGESALAHRVAASSGWDEALTADLERAAESAAGGGAVLAAGRLLLQAARLCPPGPRADRLLGDAVESMLAAGDVASAAAVADQLSDLPASARRSYLLGQLALFAGRQNEAEKLLVAAWEQCDGAVECADLAGQAATLLGQLFLPQCRASEAIRWSERAVAAAHPGGPSRGYANSLLATSLGISGRAQDGIALLSTLPGSAALASDELDGLSGRGLLELWTDDLVGARADLAAVVDAARTSRPPVTYLQALGYLAETDYRLGNWQDATVAVERATRFARTSTRSG